MAGDAMPSITIVKYMRYRDVLEEAWENTYHFDGDAPTTDSRWLAFANAIRTAEKACFSNLITYWKAIGHEAGNPVAVWFYDWIQEGSTVTGSASALTTPQAGDGAAWIRWSTTQLNTRGKPIYLRSYYHGVGSNGTTAAELDKVLAAQKSAMQTYGDLWVTGISDGTVTHHRAGPRGALAQVASVGDYLTTRTLRRRGKRPLPA